MCIRRWGSKVAHSAHMSESLFVDGLARFSGLHYTSVTRKYAVFWQPSELIVFGIAETRLELWGAAELSECQDAPVSGVLRCDDIRAV